VEAIYRARQSYGADTSALANSIFTGLYPSGSDFLISRALLQLKVDRVECLLQALDDINRFYWVHYTFAFLFIDPYFQHIYFVDEVCM
jgi:hypothetical protein